MRMTRWRNGAKHSFLILFKKKMFPRRLQPTYCTTPTRNCTFARIVDAVRMRLRFNSAFESSVNIQL